MVAKSKKAKGSFYPLLFKACGIVAPSREPFQKQVITNARAKFCKFLSFQKGIVVCGHICTLIDRLFGQDSLIETTLELKISMALCTHKSSMETNKKERRVGRSRKRIGALIKFARENSSRPKVWITFLFDELSRG